MILLVLIITTFEKLVVRAGVINLLLFLPITINIIIMFKYILFYYIFSVIVTFPIILKVDADKAKSVKTNVISFIIVVLTLGWFILPYQIIYALIKLIAKLLK